MKQCNTLTATQIRYLLALRKMDMGNGIKGASLAKKLELSRTSVHQMMEVFTILELIEPERMGGIYLTEYGKKVADRFDSYYEKVKRKLASDILNCVSLDKAIYAFIAEIPDEILITL